MLLSLNARFNMRLAQPQTADHLHSWVRTALGFDVPRAPVGAGCDAPFDYLRHAYFEDESPEARDVVVWANRSGGKTQLGAIATLLDLLFKPGIQVRILGGSFEQSSKMHAYLRKLLMSDLFIDCVRGNFTGGHVELRNGSRVEVLAGSERAVRGQRVHKLRCDEVELFSDDVWEAAQLVTRSGRCGDVYVRGAIETLSTMHRPFGLMQRLVGESGAAPASPDGNPSAFGTDQSIVRISSKNRPSSTIRRRVFRWSLLDTLEHCPDERVCATCPLWDDCGGRAKLENTRGFITIDDAIQLRSRVGEATWKAEMLCERPTRTSCVYPEFDEAVHMFDDGLISPRLAAGARGVQQGAASINPRQAGGYVIAGIDFGYRALTVILFALVDARGCVWVMDEIAEREMTTEQSIARAQAKLAERGWGTPRWIGADPAGHARNEHTGVSTITLWTRAGFHMRTRAMMIEPGIEAVRARLRRADGSVMLRIHQRCATLIRSMKMYHYPPEQLESMTPVKDGEDHAADALRYMIVNLDRAGAKAAI